MSKYKKYVDALKIGDIIGYPTDTIYGLGADPYNKNAIDKLYRLKKRNEKMPIILLVSNLKQLESFAIVSKKAKLLIEKYWPGPLTIIFKAKGNCGFDKRIFSDTGTVAVRLPNSEINKELINEFGKPITSTSANISGQLSPLSAEDVRQYFGNELPLILDDGPSKSTASSTIIDASGKELKLIRQGCVVIPEIV